MSSTTASRSSIVSWIKAIKSSCDLKILGSSLNPTRQEARRNRNLFKRFSRIMLCWIALSSIIRTWMISWVIAISKIKCKRRLRRIIIRMAVIIQRIKRSKVKLRFQTDLYRFTVRSKRKSKGKTRRASRLVSLNVRLWNSRIWTWIYWRKAVVSFVVRLKYISRFCFARVALNPIIRIVLSFQVGRSSSRRKWTDQCRYVCMFIWIIKYILLKKLKNRIVSGIVRSASYAKCAIKDLI